MRTEPFLIAPDGEPAASGDAVTAPADLDCGDRPLPAVEDTAGGPRELIEQLMRLVGGARRRAA
jgi:hypothetical protein